jgi:aryl-alcohol dehydrogenase-like predicted oxidoreductase
MRVSRLGAEGPLVSVVGLGGNNFGSRLDALGTAAVVHAALDAGITLFDTADMYGAYGGRGQAGDSERFLGAALAGRRDQVVLATKFGMAMGSADDDSHGPRGGRSYIRYAVRESLRRLDTGYIDLYQYHEFDGVTPVEETLGALAELVDEGLVRFAGCSNLAAGQLEGFVSTQARYHLLDRSAERLIIPECLRIGVGLLPYYPLANGLLTGKYRRGQPPPAGSRLSWREGWFTEDALEHVEALRAFGASRALDLLDVAIGGLAAQPGVGSVIAGAMTAEQVRANALAGEWEPGPDDLETLDKIIAPGERVVLQRGCHDSTRGYV